MTEPRLLASATPRKVNLPSLMRKPAKGMTVSEGMGKTVLSKAMRMKMPEYPMAVMMPVAKVVSASRIMPV